MSARQFSLSRLARTLFPRRHSPGRKLAARRAFLEQLERREMLSSVPVGLNDHYATPVNTNLVISTTTAGVLNNDFDAEAAALTASVVANPANGTLTSFGSDGTLTYSPNNNFKGIDSFTYEANDGSLDSNLTTVYIAVGDNFGPRTNLDERIGGNMLHTGALTLTQPLSMGHQLIYRSDSDPRPVVIVETSLVSGSTVPNTIDAVLTFGGIVGSTVSYNTTGLVAGDKLRFVLQLDASSLATGMYDWEVELTANFTGSSVSRSYTGQQAIVNRNSSEYGRNWWLDGHDQLVATAAGGLLVKGNGDTLWFAANGGSYLQAEGDLSYSTLVKNGDNTFTLTDKWGNKQNFDTGGKLTSNVDRNGNTVGFSYTSGLLTKITDPFSRDSDLTYTSGLLTTFEDLAGRSVTLSHTSDKLTSVTQVDPDGASALYAPVWSYGYDGTTNLLTSRTLPDPDDGGAASGAVTSYAYDATSRRLATITHPDSATWQLVPTQTQGLKTGTGNSIYKPSDVDAKYTDERGKVWKFETDRLGNVIELTDPLNAVTKLEFDQNGQVFRLTQADPDDGGSLTSPVTLLGYDSSGDMVKQINPDATTLTWTYHATHHQVLTATDELNRTTEFTHDSDGNMLTREDPAGNVWTYTVNTRGQVLTETTPDPDGAGLLTAATTSFAYDATASRLQTITYPGSVTEQFTYTTSDQVATITDELSHVTTLAYDALDRLTSKTLPDPDAGGALTSPVWTYKYNALGLLIEEIDPLGNDTDYEYNNRQWLTKITLPDPDGGGSLARPDYDFTYLATGQRSVETPPEFNAESLTYTYDHAGRTTSRTRLGYEESWAYDKLGRLTETRKVVSGVPTFIENYAYDSRSRLTKIIEEDTDGSGPGVPPETVYAYNNAGQISSATDQLGRQTQYTYTAAGWLNSVTLPDPDGSGSLFSSITTYGYDALGRNTGITDPLNRVTTIAYDSRNRRTSVTEPDPDGAGGASAPVTAWGYDNANRVTSVTDSLSRVTAYGYDNLDRVLTVTLPDPDAGGGLTSPVHTYAYNSLGSVTTYTDPAGEATTIAYDNLQRQTSVTQPDPDGAGSLTSPVWAYAYGANTLLASVTDPLSHVITFGYDGVGRKTSETTDLGHTTTFAYDMDDLVTSVTAPDPDGAGGVTASVTTYEYADYQRLKKITDALGGQTNFTYDAAGQLLTLDDPEGNTTTWAYDNAGRVTMETNELSDTRSFTHDAAGNLTRKVDRNAKVIQYVYDDLDRMTAEKWMTSATPVPSVSISTTTEGGPINEVQRVGASSAIAMDGGTFTLSFDGQTTSAIAYNASAATIQSELEALSNIAPGDVSVTKLQDTSTAQEWRLTFSGALAGADQSQVTIDVSSITTFMGPPTAIQATDTQGSNASEVQVVTLSNATGGTYRLAFMGQTTAAIAYNASAATVESALEALQAVDQVTVTGNAGGPWTITFAGTHANTNVQQIQGDAATAESGSVARTLSFAYDAVSQLTAADDADSGYDYTYDNLGRILTASNADTPNLPDVVLTNVYDSRSNRTSVSATIGGTADYKNDYTYDDLSRMTRVEQNGQTGGNTVASKGANLEYNALGQFSKITREYKPSGTWTEVFTSHFSYDDDNRLTGLAYKRNNVDMFTAYAWTHDNMGRVSQMTGQDGTSAYSYDKTSQVTAVDHSFQTDESYTYDSNGNREGGGYTVGSNNRMTSDGTYNYEYDDEGNQTKRTKISDGSYREYKWDHRNRLTQVLEKNSGGTILKQFDYKYDVFDRRIEKSVDNDGPGAGAAVVSRFVHDGAHIALEFNGSNTLTHRYLHGPAIDQIFADEDATNAILWAATDNLGTVRDLINSSGTVQNHLKYESFGKITAESNAAIDHLFAFTGRERDEETGNQLNRARYLQPNGKWLSHDPSGFAGGDVNLSRYIGNASTLFVDPTGLIREQLPGTQENFASLELAAAAAPLVGGGNGSTFWSRNWQWAKESWAVVGLTITNPPLLLSMWANGVTNADLALMLQNPTASVGGYFQGMGAGGVFLLNSFSAHQIPWIDNWADDIIANNGGTTGYAQASADLGAAAAYLATGAWATGIGNLNATTAIYTGVMTWLGFGPASPSRVPQPVLPRSVRPIVPVSGGHPFGGFPPPNLWPVTKPPSSPWPPPPTFTGPIIVKLPPGFNRMPLLPPTAPPSPNPPLLPRLPPPKPGEPGYPFELN